MIPVQQYGTVYYSLVPRMLVDQGLGTRLGTSLLFVYVTTLYVAPPGGSKIRDENPVAMAME